ncbi:hypothetical protein L195_g040016, partial [Trifolium pratense]
MSIDMSTCNQNNEDDWPVLFNCNDSILARQAAGLEHVITARLQQFGTAKEVTKAICHEEDRATAGMFAMMQQQQGKRITVQQQQALNCPKPAMGWYKCNVDEGFHQELNKTSAGLCLRDHTGSFTIARNSLERREVLYSRREVLALLKAMREVEHRGITN